MTRHEPRWDWEAHLTRDETAKLAALWREADEIRIRLDEIEVLTKDIQRRAAGRAKFANKLKQQV